MCGKGKQSARALALGWKDALKREELQVGVQAGCCLTQGAWANATLCVPGSPVPSYAEFAAEQGILAAEGDGRWDTPRHAHTCTRSLPFQLLLI